MRDMPNDRLFERLLPFLNDTFGNLTDDQIVRVKNGLSGLKERAKTLIELANSADFYLKRPTQDATMRDEMDQHLLQVMYQVLNAQADFSEEALHARFNELAQETDTKLGILAKNLRIAITGSKVSPSLFDVMHVLGKDETLARIKNALG